MKYEITNFKEQVNDTRKTVAYVWPRGESIIDNMRNRHDRPHELWKPMVEIELRARGVNFERLTWSQYAGCSCPCSPGFIVKGGPTHRTYHMDFRMENPPAPDANSN